MTVLSRLRSPAVMVAITPPALELREGDALQTLAYEDGGLP
jgi:hypothetical protein